jgi:hypothetical protein
MPRWNDQEGGGHLLGAEPRAGVDFFASQILFSALRQFGSKSHVRSSAVTLTTKQARLAEDASSEVDARL